MSTKNMPKIDISYTKYMNRDRRKMSEKCLALSEIPLQKNTHTTYHMYTETI